MSETLLTCDAPFRALYVEFAVAVPVFITLQLILIFITLRHEWKNRNNEAYHQTSQKLPRILYIILQILGLCWMVTDLFRLVIHQQMNILQSPSYIGCKLAAHVPKAMPVPFYTIYLYQILLRMESSFKDSYLALSKTNVYILTALIFIIVPFAYLGFFVLTFGAEVCIRPWTITNFDKITINPSFSGYCDFGMGYAPQAWYGVGLGWIPVLNLIFGIIFAYKLKQLLSVHYSDNDKVQRNMKLLMIKVGILTLTGSVSTALCWVFWLFLTRATFLYFDIFVNSLMIGLMFTYNDKYYKRCCKCFIILCLTECDKSKTKMQSEEVYQYADYRLEVDLSLLNRMAEVGSDDNVGPSTQLSIMKSRSKSNLTPEDFAKARANSRQRLDTDRSFHSTDTMNNSGDIVDLSLHDDEI